MCCWGFLEFLLTNKFNLANSFETSDGTSRDETGEVTDIGTDEEALVVRGSYKYTGPDDVVYTVTYTASKDGFVPEGAHIPKA